MRKQDDLKRKHGSRWEICRLMLELKGQMSFVAEFQRQNKCQNRLQICRYPSRFC